MAEKFCIFCGKKPEHKNMEHVIPQWLIRLTGRENKDVYENYPASHKHLNFMQFKFPACEKCNSEYADLEANVRPIMIDILDGKTVSGEKISLFMDWFDKVRIGLWLVEMCYDPELKRQVHPNFYIDSRIARADRFLSIRKLQMPANSQGISFIGTNTPLFHYFPSVFALIVNNLCFINASNVNLVAPRTGFPYLRENAVLNPFKPEVECSLIHGRKKVTNPIVKPFIPYSESITFYQPILQDVNKQSWVACEDYALNHCYDADAGKCGVFAQKGNQGNIRYLNKTDCIGTKLKASPTPNIGVDILRLQHDIHELSMGKTDISNAKARSNKLMIELYKQGIIKLY
jgi:hypothetical protein